MLDNEGKIVRTVILENILFHVSNFHNLVVSHNWEPLI